jgi:hypothetical protein
MRKSDLGPSRFVKRPPLSALFLIPPVGAGLAVGGVRYLIERQGASIAGLGYWTYNVPLGLVLTTAGVLLLWLGWTMARTRTEVFRDGLAHRTWRGESIIPFRDLKSFSYGEYQQAGIDIWLMGFLSEDGQQVAVRVQPDLFREKELPKLRDELARMLADRMAAQLDGGVPWMPGVELRRDGLYFPDSGEPPARFSERLTFRLRNNRCELRQRGVVTHEWRMDSLGFYPGFLLVLRLLLLQSLSQAGSRRGALIEEEPRWRVE